MQCSPTRHVLFAVNKSKTILPLGGSKPVLGDSVFVAPSASVIGDVKLGAGSSVWYGAVVRGERRHAACSRVAERGAGKAAGAEMLGEGIAGGWSAAVHTWARTTGLCQVDSMHSVAQHAGRVLAMAEATDAAARLAGWPGWLLQAT